MNIVLRLINYLTFIALLSVATNASAIPAFARKSNISCTACHTAWPSLNATGRSYKENGYRFSPIQTPEIKVADNLSWDKSLPVSVLLVARPYDKKDSGETKLRALHEAELMIAGPMGEKMSGFFELEAEDEVTNDIGLDTGIHAAQLTYSHSQSFNLQFGYQSLLAFDPYLTYSAHLRMTRGHLSVIDQGFGGADNDARLRDSRQNVIAYGRPVNNLFYGISLSGVGGDAEGEEASTITARFAYDIKPGLMFGLLSISGSCPAGATNCTVERDYERTGIDFQIEVEQLIISGAVLNATDDNATATAEIENNAQYVQVLYADHTNGRANWAPLIRFDNYEKSGGSETIDELTLGFNYYFSDNVRGMVEFWDRNGDGSTADDDRLTLQLFAAF